MRVERELENLEATVRVFLRLWLPAEAEGSSSVKRLEMNCGQDQGKECGGGEG